MTQELTFRLLKASDIGQITALWKKLAREHELLEPKLYAPSAKAETAYRKFLKKRIRARSFLIGCFKGMKLVGYAFGWIAKRPPAFKVSKAEYLNEIFVLKEERSKGLGKKLLKEFLKWCKKKKVKTVQLSVFTEKEAVKFYKRMGFRELTKKMTMDID